MQDNMGPISHAECCTADRGSEIHTKLFKHEGSSPKEVTRLVAVDIPLVPAGAFLPSGSSLYCLSEQALQHHIALHQSHDTTAAAQSLEAC